MTIEQALGEFRRQNWPEARVMFARAHEISPSARTLRGLGVVSFEMRDYVSAVQYLAAAIEDTRQRLSDEQRKESQALLDRAATYVGVYALSVEPAESTIRVDGGEPARDAEGNLLMSFGRHKVVVSASGYESQTLEVAVKGGERKQLAVALISDAPVAEAEGVEPDGPSDASASLAQAEDAAFAETEESAAHEGSFRGSGLKYSWVALSAAAVFGGAAGLSWALGQSEFDDLDKRCEQRSLTDSPCLKSNTDTDSVVRYQRLTNASLGLAAGSLVLAGVLVTLEWPRERQVAVSMGAQGVLVRGSF